MEKHSKKISLGLTSQEFEAGVHICQIFNEDEERHGAIIDFILSGLQTGEKVACFSEIESEQTLSNLLKEKGYNYEDLIQTGDFVLSKTTRAYFEDNKFDPERMLKLLQEFYNVSQSSNKSGARVIGEMTPDIEHVEGGTRLMEYESKVSLLVQEYPINAVCQYDAREFDGATIFDILKVHPYVIIRGNIVHNPYYEKPNDYLAKHNC